MPTIAAKMLWTKSDSHKKGNNNTLKVNACVITRNNFGLPNILCQGSNKR